MMKLILTLVAVCSLSFSAFAGQNNPPFATGSLHDWSAFQRFSGGLSAYGPTINITDPQYAGGAKGDGTTDDTAAVQSAINAAISAGATLVIPYASNCYKTTAALTITGNLNIVGVYLADNWNGGIDAPTRTPPLAGSVICPTSSGANAITISGTSSEVSIQNLGIRFLTPFNSTGDGIAYLPGQTVQGLSGSIWQNVKVYGHDGNHYAFNLNNPIYDTFIGLQAHGGGGTKVYGNAIGFFYGNLVFINPFMDVVTAGSGKGYDIEANGSHYINLVTFIRPQANVNSIGLPGTTPPTSSQYIYYQDANVQGVTLIAPDLETNVSSIALFGAAGVSNYFDYQGGFTSASTVGMPAWGPNGVMLSPRIPSAGFTDLTSSGSVSNVTPLIAFPGWHIKASNPTQYAVTATLTVAPPFLDTNVTTLRNDAIYATGEIFTTSNLTSMAGLFAKGTVNINKNDGVNNTEIGTGNTTGGIIMGTPNNPIKIGGTVQYTSILTVATLPTCNTAAKGTKSLVSDATAPAYLTALIGGGSVVAPAFCDGSAWVAD